MSRGTIGVCVLVGVAVIGVVALGGLVVGTASATEDTQNTSLGADISSFMQASSVEATDEVEEETFEAALNRTEDPSERRALIEARQERLQERSEQLRSQHEDLGNASDIRSRSIATRVSVGAAGLERSANRTEAVAVRNGVDTEQLDEIRSNARTLRGPEVAELARSIGGPPGGEPPMENRAGPPGANQTGPPGDHTSGPSGPRSDATGNGPMDARDAERGPPATGPREHASSNGSNPNGAGPNGAPGAENSDRGPPDAPGNTGNGPSDAPGNTGNGPSDAPGNTSNGPPNNRSP